MATVAASARSICTTALQTLGVVSPYETVKAPALAYAYNALNTLVDSWAAERGSIFTQAITTYVFPANTPAGVTLGPGGTWSQARPVFLSGANYVVPGSSPPVREPLGLMDDEDYFALGIPTLQSALPTNLYYNPTFDAVGGLGRVQLYPVPTQAISVGIQTPTAIAQFADYDTLYLFPPAYRRALHWNLQGEIADAFGKALTPLIEKNAFTSKQAMKTPNFEKLSLVLDPAVTGRSEGGYVIYSDTQGWM